MGAPLAYVTGLVNQQLLLQNEYLAAENRILRAHLPTRLGHLRGHRYVLHDRDTKFCASFRALLATGNVNCLALPPRSPNLNAFAERWVRSVKRSDAQTIQSGVVQWWCPF